MKMPVRTCDRVGWKKGRLVITPKDIEEAEKELGLKRGFLGIPRIEILNAEDNSRCIANNAIRRMVKS